jgi:hypothetical protein
MKVFSLACSAGHVFEGWFGGESDYLAQSASGLLSCPLCGLHDVKRLPSAPRLNLGAAAPDDAQAEGTESSARAQSPESAQAAYAAAWLEQMQSVLAQTRDVGERFPEEARRMHYGESPTEPIRGQASADEARALREEGIELMVLPVPESLKKGSH